MDIPYYRANDILNVISWISAENNNNKVYLFGWSIGSTLSLLVTQKNTKNMASLIVFGFWKDLDVKIPADVSDVEPPKT